MDQEFTLKTIKNISYNSLARGGAFLLRIGTSLILAQNLVASDYGVIGFSMVIIGFLSRFNDLGITSAIVQRADMDQKILYIGFSLKLIAGIVICGLCNALAPKAKLFFDHPEVDVVIMVLAVNFVISTFSFLPESMLARELEYRKLSLANILSAVSRSGISIILVLFGLKYWSIVWGEIAATLMQALALNWLRPVKFGLCFNMKIARDLVGFGGKLFLSGLIIFILFNADNLIIGGIGGSAILGFYTLAFNWGTISCGVLSDAVHNVLFPTFCRIQKDITKVKTAYLKSLEYISMIGIMANITLLVNSREFLFFILGRGTDKWVPAVFPLKILCIYGIVRIILEPVGNVVISMGMPGVLLKANLIAGLVEIGLLYPVMKYFGISGVAVLITIAYASQYAIYLPFLKKNCDVEGKELFISTFPAALSGLIVILSSFLMDKQLNFSKSSMVMKVIYCLLSYFILYGIITKWRIVKETISIISVMIMKRENNKR